MVSQTKLCQRFHRIGGIAAPDDDPVDNSRGGVLLVLLLLDWEGGGSGRCFNATVQSNRQRQIKVHFDDDNDRSSSERAYSNASTTPKCNSKGVNCLTNVINSCVPVHHSY